MQEQKRRTASKKYSKPVPEKPTVDEKSRQRFICMITHVMNEVKRAELFYNDKSEGKGTQNL